MNIITVDFETYYSQDYSLSFMSTEGYVSDPRFEIILVGIKINDNKPYWITGTHRQIAQHFESIKLREAAVLCHNTMFDGLILALHFGIYPILYLDSMACAQALLKPFVRSISLASCLQQLNLGIAKGTVVKDMKGRTRDSLTDAEMKAYGQYCCDDCEGEWRLFKYLAPQLPRDELYIIDLTLRMYFEPEFELDANLLAEELAGVRTRKEQVMASLPASITKDRLMSNVKFAELLTQYNVDLPLKISPTTGSITYAFARTDTGWKELEEEWADDPLVSAILAARMNAKSTLEESRYERLLNIAVEYGKFRIPIRYAAAHTYRDGGTESINAQNFPRIDKSRMRFAVRAPKGSVVMAADLAQIEARITAWLAGAENLLEDFRNKVDSYVKFIARATGIDTVKGRSKEDDRRRFIGKTCVLGLGFGMSAKKLQATLRMHGIKVELEECQKYVDLYRRVLYPNIPFLWRKFDQAIPILAGQVQGVMKVGPVTVCKGAIVLPNKMAIVYNNVRFVETDKYKGWVYNYAGETRTLWGGKITENVVQALARIMIMGYMLDIRKRTTFKPALRQHDELDYIIRAPGLALTVPPGETKQRWYSPFADKVARALEKLMRIPPWWAPTLPVEVEINYGPTLGDCK